MDVIDPTPLTKQRLKLRLGAQVTATDGPLGELADIIVDPVTSTVTHVVIEPRHRHLLSRLVPIDLVENDDQGDVRIALGIAAFRDLPRVSFSEFVPLASPIEVGDDWDITGQSVIAQPYWGGDVLGMGRTWSAQAQVSFDRIPKGECEIRRNSMVVGDDGKSVGHVDGLVVDDQHVGGVVVRTGPPGLRHRVVVPLGAVHNVTSEAIALSVDRRTFDALPNTDALFAPDGDESIPSPLQAQLGSAIHRIGGRGRDLRARARRSVGRRSG